jgi:hypothetical protein
MSIDYLQLALGKFNVGKHQWYGWKKDWTGDKRMSYENIILNDKTATMPTEEQVNAKIQELKNADTAKANNRTSGKKKLKDLGLSDNEINALLGV